MPDETQLTELATFMQMHTGLIFDAYQRGRDSAKPLEGGDRTYYLPQLPPQHVQVQQLPQQQPPQQHQVRALPPAAPSPTTALTTAPTTAPAPVVPLLPSYRPTAQSSPDFLSTGPLVQIVLSLCGIGLCLALGLKVSQLMGLFPSPAAESVPAQPVAPAPPPAPAAPAGLPPLPQ